jgi:DNA modification methylase
MTSASLKKLPRIRLEHFPIGKLRGWAKNPRTISDEELTRLKKGLEHFGVVDPIITDRRLMIIGGHQRVRALKELGYTGTVPVVRLKRNLTRSDVAELNLALNRISGEWDNEKLAPILQELIELPNFELTGFTPQEANLIIESFPDMETDQSEDQAPPLPSKPLTRPGQLWKLGPHRLLCADATDPEAWKKLFGKDRAVLCITDPPYGVEYDVSNKSVKNKVTGKYKPHKAREPIFADHDTQAATKALEQVFNHLIPEGVAYVTCGTDSAVDIINWLRAHEIHYGTLMVWHKHFPVVSWNRYHAEHELIIYCGRGSRPGRNARWFGPKQETTVWDIPLDAHGDRIHPTQKPVALYERAMINSSAPGEIVVDCFSGSGSCIVAAEKHGRHAYLMEVDPAYCDVTIRRWMILTGQNAESAKTPLPVNQVEK